MTIDEDVSAPFVLIIANYTGYGTDNNNRFHELARRIAARGVRVQLVTSTFSHSEKQQCIEDDSYYSYELVQLPEPGYKRNISFARLRSQRHFARAVRSYLSKLESTPDVIYAAVPPPGVGAVCGNGQGL